MASPTLFPTQCQTGWNLGPGMGQLSLPWFRLLWRRAVGKVRAASHEFVIVMARRRVTGFVNYLASLPLEIFEEVMRHVLGVFTRRIGEHWHSRYLDDFYHNASVTLGLDPWHKTNIGLGIS